MDASVGLTIDPDLARKLQRLSKGEAPRVLDLFSGCGGISLGFQKAGCRIEGNIEIDPLAARSHALNFHKDAGKLLALHSKARDITAVEPVQLAKELGLGPVGSAIDVLVGGPPCQAYSRVGRAKLREIADHPEAFKMDPRGNLYLRYLAYVRAFKPLAIMMENVPDILHYSHHNIIEEMVETLDCMGYDGRYSLINSAFHGVPQMRDRVFLIAYRKELRTKVRFPRATHHMRLPLGYAGTRAVALRYVDLLGGSGYTQPDLGDESLPFPVTAMEAIGDLPAITGHLEGTIKRGARRFNEVIPYRDTNELSSYAAQMRQWAGFESHVGISDHVIRFLPRDPLTFREMPEGAEYPTAHKVALLILAREAERLGVQKGTKKYDELRGKLVPPYDVTKFPNRWWKLRRDFPVRTLMAHIGKDTYSHIHYDPEQARTISVREAARLQSFPDGFKFEGTMNHAFRQIGNAVPALMAFAIAEVIKGTLTEAVTRVTPQVRRLSGHRRRLFH